VLFQNKTARHIACDLTISVFTCATCRATSPLHVVLHCATSPPLSTVNDPYASFHEAWRENDFLGRYLVSLRCSYHRCVDMYTSFRCSTTCRYLYKFPSFSFFLFLSLSHFFPPPPSLSLALYFRMSFCVVSTAH